MVRRPAFLLLATVVLLTSSQSVLAGSTYLALGDSLAFGETDFMHNPSNGDRGYVSLFADTLRQLNGGVRPSVVNLAFDGETTSSFFTGAGNVFGPNASLMNTNYSVPAIQYTMMLNTLAATAGAGNPIGYVTVSLGANDLYGLLSDPNFLNLPLDQQQTRVMAALSRVQSNYTNLLLELASNLPAAKIWLVGYYNPFAVFPAPMGELAAEAVQGLNSVIAGEAGAFGATYIDTYNPLLHHETEYTYILTNYQGFPNVHPNDLGYSVIGAQLAATVPEPRSAVLACIGVGCLMVIRLFHRR